MDLNVRRMQRNFSSVITKKYARGSTLCAFRADSSSLSLLLMVPLTTQQLLHLAVGLNHTPHMQWSLHMHKSAVLFCLQGLNLHPEHRNQHNLLFTLSVFCARLHVSCQPSVTRSLIELSTSGLCCMEDKPTQTTIQLSSRPFSFPCLLHSDSPLSVCMCEPGVSTNTALKI